MPATVWLRISCQVERQSSSVTSSIPAASSVSRPSDSQRSLPAAIQSDGPSIIEKDCCQMIGLSSVSGAECRILNGDAEVYGCQASDRLTKSCFEMVDEF